MNVETHRLATDTGVALAQIYQKCERIVALAGGLRDKIVQDCERHDFGVAILNVVTEEAEAVCGLALGRFTFADELEAEVRQAPQAKTAEATS